ncbi:class I SAM-dependent methyltransferase [uncultured Porticoccus sp.]|uniref:class I SAM-dependent methyltransferase n=1 Tax=uncultured Porticoccus sp. TaxID=1256050 RepID=UPI00261009F0|nr:class I SAM-dependent methyltransferase [uncultured Porticoccus sp.]
MASAQDAPDAAQERLMLVVDDGGLSLQQLGPKAPGPVRCEFALGAARHRRLHGGGRGQDIAKATGLSRSGFRPQLLDLTAGLGRDGFILASLGAQVTMIERNPVIFALLADGLSRACDTAEAEEDPALAGILQRIKTVCQDSVDYLKTLTDQQCPDVIYLDPMFPPREKSSKVKKEMQIFHQLVGPDDTGELLTAALGKARYRVVVKRPAHAPVLNGREPGYSLKGKSTRFDIYPLQKLP